jgi:hypothetical protein
MKYIKLFESFTITTRKKFYFCFDIKPHIIPQLAEGKLIGLKGVSDNKNNVEQWFIHKDTMLVMNQDEVLKLNPHLEQLDYLNPDYMLSNGMNALFRVYQSGKDDTRDVMQKIGNNFERLMKTHQKNQPFADDLSSFIGYYGSLFAELGQDKEINSLKDFQDFFYLLLSELYPKKSYDIKKISHMLTREVCDELAEKIIKLCGYTFMNEHEWITNGYDFIIPQNSQLFISRNASNFKKYNADLNQAGVFDKYKIHFVSFPDIQRYSDIRFKKQYADFPNQKKFKDDMFGEW